VSVTIQISVRCAHRFSLSQPKIHRPRKVDSMKNAIIVSRASAEPNALPANSVSPLHAMPSWNSMTSPVTMPIA
jgi:hypothetical protein